MKAGGETLYIILTEGILGNVTQTNTQRIAIYIFRTTKASSGEYRLHIYIWYKSVFS